MKPYIHAQNSVRRYGGVPEDYIKIHDFFDSTKAAFADVRHRAILHNSFGIFLVEKVFGTTITNSDGKVVSVRDIGEDHVMEDCGAIPTIEQWLKDLPVKGWMGGKQMAKHQERVDTLRGVHADLPATDEAFAFNVDNLDLVADGMGGRMGIHDSLSLKID